MKAQVTTRYDTSRIAMTVQASTLRSVSVTRSGTFSAAFPGTGRGGGLIDEEQRDQQRRG